MKSIMKISASDSYTKTIRNKQKQTRASDQQYQENDQ